MTRSLTLRRSLAALALPLLLGGLAACGSDDESGGSASSSSESSGSSSENKSGDEVDSASFVDDLKAGLKASTTAQMNMKMDMGGQALTADGEVDYTTSPPQMAMTMESPAAAGQKIEMRLVDSVMYMNMGQMTGNKFVEYDLSDPKNLPPGMDQLTSTMNPLAAFDSFEKGVKSVVFVGDEEVNGEELGHYKVEVDTTKLDQFKELQTQVQMPKTVAYDLWLDAEDRMRKMTMSMDMSTPMQMEVSFDDWGSPVDIAPPPASQIVQPPKA